MTRLSEYFTGVAIKRLSVVETDFSKSHQHEFNGAIALVELFGVPEGKVRISCKWIYFGDNEDDIYEANAQLTWYDSRESHQTRTEYRLYYQSNEVIDHAGAEDLLIIGQRTDESCLIVICKKGSTYESQLLWLFNIDRKNKFELFETAKNQSNIEIGFAERQILETLGIEVNIKQENWLEFLIETFGDSFPTTKVFSMFARDHLDGIFSLEDPDHALISWVNQEEVLFRTLEEHIVGKRVKEGFDDVDSFVEFSLSVQNRRKSRMGHALENHLQQIFIDHNIAFERGKVTENNSKPDFLFPGIIQYKNPSFPSERLFMLGSKSTCKDRWRQILAEAARIKLKHLFTLEPGISENQTDEMVRNNVCLVLPMSLHLTYSQTQQNHIINLQELISILPKNPGLFRN